MDHAQRSVTERIDRHILEMWITPRITPTLIEEHRLEPFGKHSPDLDLVLNFLRRDSDPRKPLYVAIRDPQGRFHAAAAQELRGEPVRSVDELSFATEEEAEHHIVLRQLEDLGIRPKHFKDE